MPMPVGGPSPEEKRKGAIVGAVMGLLVVIVVLAGAWSIIKGLMRCRCRSARGCPGARRWRGRH